MKKIVVSIIAFLLMFIIFIGLMLIVIEVNDYFTNQCIKNGGTPIYRVYPFYDRCIGSDKE